MQAEEDCKYASQSEGASMQMGVKKLQCQESFGAEVATQCEQLLGN